MPAASSAVRTPAQNRALHALAGELATRSGLGRDEVWDVVVRPACRKVSGQEHTSRLTPAQAAALLDLVQREVRAYTGGSAGRTERAEHEPWGDRGEGPRSRAPVTRAQLEVIDALFAFVGWAPPARRAFTLRQCKVPWPQTQHHADAVIEPLQAIAMRHVDHEEIWRRVVSLAGQTDLLDEWKRNFVADLLRQYAAQDFRTVLTPHKLAKILEAEAWIRART